MITDLKVGDKVRIKTKYLYLNSFYKEQLSTSIVGQINTITEEWIWVDWGFGDIWNHKSSNLEKVIETKK